jgi:hypothetical protein
MANNPAKPKDNALHKAGHYLSLVAQGQNRPELKLFNLVITYAY